MTKSRAREDGLERWLPWLALGLALLVVAVIRIRLLDVPLERDEGEYAYIGSLLLRGVSPWAEAWNMKYPGIYAVYALLIGVGGPSVSAIHAGLLVANTWSAIACALLARRWFANDGAAAVAGAAFAAGSLAPAVLGLWSHAEPFALAFALGGLLLALEPRGRAALFGAGVLFACAPLVKQNATPLALFGAAWVTWVELRAQRGSRESLERLGSFAAGALLPPVAVGLALWYAGVFERFWFWTVTYASTYGAQRSLDFGIHEAAFRARLVMRAQAVWWLAAAVGLSAVAWSREIRERALFPLGLLFAGFAGASFGFNYRPQYFVLMLPGVSLLAAAAVLALTQRARRWRAPACVALALLGLVTPIAVQSHLLLGSNPDELSRGVYGANPFPEARVIAREIAAQTAPGATIGVIGSEPEIYFYSGRRAATGYVYTYPLMEPQPYARRMQEEMIAQLDAAKPEMLVFANIAMSWLARPDSVTAVLDWFERVSASQYETVVVAEIVSPTETKWVRGEEAKTYAPRSPYWVSLLRRKS